MSEIIGTTVTAPVTGGDKFRVTWEYWLSSILPSWFYGDAPQLAERVREWLPSAGFVPVSNPSAKAGDQVIVFDVRLSMATWSSGKNVAQVLAALDAIPAALRVQKLQRLTGTETSAELQQGQQDAIEQGDKEAESNILEKWAADFAKKIGDTTGKLADVILVVAIAAIVVGGVYIYRETRK